MAAVTGAVWKCASSSENVERFQELGLVAILVKILKDNCDALDDLQVGLESFKIVFNNFVYVFRPSSLTLRR